MSKPDERARIRIFITGVLIIAIILVFNIYTRKNKQRISEQNASYIENSTVQTAEWIKDILDNALHSINNTANLYGKTLSDNEVQPEDLKDIADSTVFDYVDFVNEEGMDINAQGSAVDVSDRSYYIKGMQGKSGIDGAYNSKVTNERLVVFYAPVKYNGKIIGVLAGHYLEERMRTVMENMLFDEVVPSLICMRDGVVISSVGMEAEGDNVLECLEDMVSQEVSGEISDALASGESCGFVYKAGKVTASAYMAPLLPENGWMLIQMFPAGASAKMVGRANSVGILLEVELVALFICYAFFLIFQERRQKKRLLKEKREAEKIVEGINRLFNRFIIVDMENDAYRYVNRLSPSFQGFPASGKYSEFLDFFSGRFVETYGSVSMEEVLSEKYIRENLSKEVPFLRFEYQIQRNEVCSWETIAIIALEWRGEKPASVLLAVQDSTELKEQEQRTRNALKEAFQAAEAANRAKSDFLSRMSHDIRTPMNAIMGMTAIAAMHMDDQPRVTDCLNKIAISSRHLLGLINEVLDMSKIESGKLDLMEEEFALPETVEGLLGIFHPQLEAKKQMLSVTLNGITHERVVGDSQRLSQVLVNIMGNAVKFTPDGGKISLHINENPSRVQGMACYEFIFTDNGIGMDKEFVDKMFEPFSRAADSRTGKTEGTGLGMSIARNIVQMMNGEIHVKSKKGKGTQVTATVFLKYIPGGDEECNMLEGYRVMVVDDEQAACENACNILASIGMLSEWFTDGDEAIQALAESQRNGEYYAVVILDWKMPGKDGVEVAREIREKIGGDIPIIILSAYDWSAIEQEAMDAGVNAFIAKPMFKSRLVYVMKQLLVKSGGTEEKEKIPAALEGQEFKGSRVLIVEDNELNMEIAEELLAMSGFEVDGAMNGKEAVDRLQGTAPGTYQLVLMDIQMPVMNGYEATAAIRESGREDLKTLPIVAMTADAFSEDVVKAAEAGMDGHIAKPIDVDKLMAALKDILE